jgi:ParB family chromosome partitioning protein
MPSLPALACRLAAIRIDWHAVQRARQAEIKRDYDYTVEEANGTEVIHHVVQGTGGKWVANEVIGTIGGTGTGAWEGVTVAHAKASSKAGGLAGPSKTSGSKQSGDGSRAPRKSATPKVPSSANTANQKVDRIPITAIHTGLNPREYFDPAKIRELAESIKANGLLQPISVRPHEGGYQLIAGERRFRALQLLGETHAPAIVHNVDDKTAHELALIENINREDMRPGETARAYQNMLRAGGTVRELADHTGKTTEYIQQHLDLLTLPDHLQALVDKGQLPMGIVRDIARLSPKGQEEAAERILRDDLGVKSARRLIKTISEREQQLSMFAEVKPVTQEARESQAKYQDTMNRMTDMLTGMDDHHVELAAQATDAPSREAERLGLMIKQLQRMQAAMEKESYRREKRAAVAVVQRHQMATLVAQVAALQTQVAHTQFAPMTRAFNGPVAPYVPDQHPRGPGGKFASTGNSKKRKPATKKPKGPCVPKKPRAVGAHKVGATARGSKPRIKKPKVPGKPKVPKLPTC